MDSRIREIEQWVKEAKRGLEEGGREEYLRRLYLLDAEIRKVIKENVPLPDQAASSGAAPRGSFIPPVAYLSAAAVLLLLVGFVGYPLLKSQPGTPVNLARDINPLLGEHGASDLRELGFIPDSIDGEEILGPDWQPAEEIEVPGESAYLVAGPFFDPGTVPGVAAPALDLRTRHMAVESQGSLKPGVYGNESVGVVILAGSVDQPGTSENGPTTSRFVRSDLFPDAKSPDKLARFTYFPEADKLKGEIVKPEKPEPKVKETPSKVVQGAAVQVVVDNVDKKLRQPVDDVDNP